MCQKYTRVAITIEMAGLVSAFKEWSLGGVGVIGTGTIRKRGHPPVELGVTITTP